MDATNIANDLITNAGLCIIPVRMPDKKPTIKWTPYKTRLPRPGELIYNGNLAVVTGKVSGNLFALDCDWKYDLTGTLPERFQNEVGEELWDEICKVAYIQRTVNNGVHIFLRCEEIEGNQKLAQRLATDEERAKNPDENRKVLLETRSEGGFVIVAPTEGYTSESGSLSSIGFISIEQKERLFEVCRSFDEIVDEVKPPKKFTQSLPGLPPWQDYDQRSEPNELLESHGWKFYKTVGANDHWSRPGKSGATSGTYNKDLNLFRCFSTSTQLQADKSYSPSALYTFLECGGDFSEAARQLYSLGFGKRITDKIGDIKERTPHVELPVRQKLRMSIAYVKRNNLSALSLAGLTLINFGELFTLIGLPGTGKSAIVEAIITAFLNVDSFGFKFNSRGFKALVIDSERPPDDVCDSYRNIFRRMEIEPDKDLDRLDYLTLSEFGKPEDLKAILEREISTGEYELVILDGILDFSQSFIDDKDSAEVVRWARALAVKWNIALVVTMHPNKGTEIVAGHLGAFLYRWSRALLFVRSVKGNKSIKELTGEPDMAKLSHADLGLLDPVYFSWDPEKGLLMPCDFTPSEDRGQQDKMFNAFKAVLPDGKRLRHNELINALVNIGHKKETMRKWVKKGVELEMLTNTNGIYSIMQNEGF